MGKHGTPVKKEKLATINGELDRTAKDLGVADYKLDGELQVAPITTKAAPHEKKPIKIKSYADGLAAVGMDKELAAGKLIAPRKAYGAALVALGEADKRVVGLDADVKNSTHAEWFAKKFPAQYLECKIAEQNMISVAAGAGAAGKIPFCSTFAKFVVRAYDQVEMASSPAPTSRSPAPTPASPLPPTGPARCLCRTSPSSAASVTRRITTANPPCPISSRPTPSVATVSPS